MDNEAQMEEAVKQFLNGALKGLNSEIYDEAFKKYGSQRLIVSLEKDGIHIDLPKDKRVLPIMISDLNSKIKDEVKPDCHIDVDLQMIYSDYLSSRIDEKHEKIMEAE